MALPVRTVVDVRYAVCVLPDKLEFGQPLTNSGDSSYLKQGLVMKRYCIIGNGTAGASAAEQIRKRDNNGSIVIFSRETHPYYYRPRLPEYIAGQAELDDFTLHPLAQYKNWNVDLRFGENVISIDPAAKEITGTKSGKIPYDELLLASGSSCFLPPVKGNDKVGVFTLRTLNDAKALMAAAKKTKTAVLVGGGLLGLEAGHALINLGLKVEVVELMDRLLPRQLDHESAGLLQGELEKMGFSFHLAAKAQEIQGGDAAAGLVLADSTCIEGGIILFSAGVRANLELARQAGLAIDKAVKVDQFMRTSVPGIWAAGDVAESNGQPCGIWPIAMAQGEAAGASMAGDLTPYVPQAPSTTLKVAGIDLISAGNIDAENAGTSKRFVSGSVYRKIVLEGDTIKGIIFLGSTNGAEECIAAMNQGRHLGSLVNHLDQENFNPPLFLAQD